ncbi:glycosyltransferase [Halobacteriaceae archaeon GCM10025711]
MPLSASVVVPAYNEETRLANALDSLADQDAEVVVVACGDGSLDVARSHDAADVVLEDGDGTGAGAARNQGAQAATGDVVLFTDADTVVPPHWVEAHRRHFEDPAVVGTGGPLRPLEAGLKHRVLFKLLSDWWYRVSWPVGFVQQSGNNAGFLREAFLAEGGFDEELAFMEDTELSMRMKHHGEMVYDPDCWVETSVRRQEAKGYGGLFLTYLRAYLNHYLLHRELEDGYFREL